MGAVDTNVLWNKLQDAALVSETGANGTNVGATYVPAKFDNGMRADAGTEKASFNPTNINPNEFAVGWWMNTDYNVVNGVPADAAQHFMLHMYQGANSIFQLIMLTAPWHIYFNQIDAGNVVLDNTSDWSAGVLNHFLLVVSRSANFSGANTVALYINDVKTGSVNTALSDRSGSPIDTVYLGNHIAASVAIDGIMDNLKIYENPSAVSVAEILANRNTEGFPIAAPTNVAASDGTYWQKVAVTWDAVGGASGYNIYRSLDDIDYEKIKDNNAGTTYDDTTAEQAVVYYYKVSAIAGAAESDLSTSDSGYRVFRVEPVEPQSDLPRVEFLGVDAYALGHIDKLFKIKYMRTFKKDKLIRNNISINVKNFNNFYSVNHPASLFSNIFWRYKPFKIYNKSNDLLWDGLLESIPRNHAKKTAKLISSDLLLKYRDIKVEYESGTWETPADAVKNVLDFYEFVEYNNKSITDSSARYEANDCYIKCHIEKGDDMNLQTFLDKMGAVGCADVYTFYNEIYFKHWKPFTGGVKVKLVESDLRTAPMVGEPESEIINQYDIDYVGSDDTPANDTDNNNIGNKSREVYNTHELESLDGSAENEIEIKDLASAVYLGECYIRRSHRNLSSNPQMLTRIKFDLKGNHREWIDLETYFRLTLSDEGWTEKLFEIFEITIDLDKNNINILAYGVDENA